MNLRRKGPFIGPESLKEILKRTLEKMGAPKVEQRPLKTYDQFLNQ